MTPVSLSITTVFTRDPVGTPLPPTMKFLVDAPEMVTGVEPGIRSEFCMSVQLIPVPASCFSPVMTKLSRVTPAGAKMPLTVAGK